MAGVRARKQQLVLHVSAYVISGQLSRAQGERFELMYRRARSPEEQDAVTKAMHFVIDGWKDPGIGGMAGGAFEHLRRVMVGTDPYAPSEEDEDLRHFGKLSRGLGWTYAGGNEASAPGVGGSHEEPPRGRG